MLNGSRVRPRDTSHPTHVLFGSLLRRYFHLGATSSRHVRTIDHELAHRYAGTSYLDKLRDIRRTMESKGQEALVLSKLDEVAWLLNLRGSDIVYNPVFFAYVLVLPESATLYCDAEKLPAQCTDDKEFMSTYTVQPYTSFVPDLHARNLSSTVWVGSTYSYAVAQGLKDAELLEDDTPVCTAKAVKNSVELSGMRQCHLRDAVALTEFFRWIEIEIASGRHVTEWTAAVRLEEFRAEQDGYQSPSFATISSSGPSGSVIHYHPHEGSCRDVTADELYLLDSGGQYVPSPTPV
jgi:Xaa-Pro aminopeptidase